MKKHAENGRLQQAARLIRALTRLHIPLYAANAGYFIILAVFPMLVLLLSLLRYTNLRVETLTDLLQGVLPAALLPAAERLIINT